MKVAPTVVTTATLVTMAMTLFFERRVVQRFLIAYSAPPAVGLGISGPPKLWDRALPVARERTRLVKTRANPL